MTPTLEIPSTRVHRSFLDAMAEFAIEGRGGAGDNSMIGDDLRAQAPAWESEEGFARYVARLVDEASDDAPRPPGIVPCTTLWWVDGDEYVGRLAVRHRLTPALRDVGGHVGYDVRPSMRRQGHATAMLAAGLPVAHGLDIDPALITCDIGNVPSQRVIEANGGVLEDVRGDKRRYWVPTGGDGCGS